MLGPTLINSGPFVTVDIETTGCRPGTSSIIEIGAARIESGVIAARFSTLVSPVESIPPAITHLTGITHEMVAGAPSIAEAIAAFRVFADGAVLIAHNHRFDMSFLDFEAERAWGSPFARPVLDTLTLARRLHPDLSRHNLRDLALHYATDAVPSHRALPDALATAEVFIAMIPGLLAEGLATAADIARFTGLAQHGDIARKLALATHLPDEPGVYLFRDSEERVVFVGKARALRTRIRNHFYAADDCAFPGPASQTTSIHCFTMVSPLDAALLEVRLQDRYLPPFNRDGHQQRDPLYLHLDTSSEFPSVTPTRRRLRSGTLLGPLSNRWAAATLADAISGYFGLRRCRCTLDQCESRYCEQRNRHLCHLPDTSDAGRAAYSSGVRAALAVFDGHDGDFREVLRAMQDRAAGDERFEEAAHYRDAIRALDRTLGTLAVARRATGESATAIIEGDERSAAILFAIRGWYLTTLRLTREDVVSGRYLTRLARLVSAVERHVTANAAVTPLQLRDMAIIDAYRQQQSPLTVVIDSDADAAVAHISTALRRLMRVPRKRHGAASSA